MGRKLTESLAQLSNVPGAMVKVSPCHEAKRGSKTKEKIGSSRYFGVGIGSNSRCSIIGSYANRLTIGWLRWIVTCVCTDTNGLLFHLSSTGLQKEELSSTTERRAVVRIHLLGEIVQRYHDAVGTVDVTFFPVRENAADKTIVTVMTPFPHLCHDAQHILGIEITMHFDFVAKKSESVGEISLIDRSTFTLCLPCKLLIVDDQCNSVRERLHAVFVDSIGFVPAFWIHQSKAETDRLKIQTIKIEGVEVLDLYLPVAATVDVSSFPVQDIELCNEIKFLIIMYSPNRLHDNNIVSLHGKSNPPN